MAKSIFRLRGQPHPPSALAFRSVIGLALLPVELEEKKGKVTAWKGKSMQSPRWERSLEICHCCLVPFLQGREIQSPSRSHLLVVLGKGVSYPCEPEEKGSVEALVS